MIMKKRKVILVLFFLFFSAISYAQSVRIYVLGGGNIDFIFNSMSSYTNGITYQDWTVIGMTITDPTATYTTWDLKVEAQDPDADGFITGSNPINKIPFSTIELSAKVTAGCVKCKVIFPGPSPFNLALPAPGAGVALVDGSKLGMPEFPPYLNFATDEIAVSYYCGTTAANNLLGKAPDYYTDIIQFTLTMYP